MLKPQLKYQINEQTNEVACLASFVPTFAPIEPQDEIQISSETPEQLDMSGGKDFCFIFVVDRSGSMAGKRMEITKEALKLFI
jgi:Mg-chelatase subunit ChlD